MPRGRPRIPLSAQEVKNIEAMAGLGMSMTQISHVLGMSRATLERRMKDSPPELAAKEALDRGRAMAISAVSKTAFEMAKSGKESGMTQFWLQCRANWKKTESKEISGPDGAAIEIASEDEASLMARIKDKVKKLKILEDE